MPAIKAKFLHLPNTIQIHNSSLPLSWIIVQLNQSVHWNCMKRMRKSKVDCTSFKQFSLNKICVQKSTNWYNLHLLPLHNNTFYCYIFPFISQQFQRFSLSLSLSLSPSLESRINTELMLNITPPRHIVHAIETDNL